MPGEKTSYPQSTSFCGQTSVLLNNDQSKSNSYVQCLDIFTKFEIHTVTVNHNAHSWFKIFGWQTLSTVYHAGWGFVGAQD